MIPIEAGSQQRLSRQVMRMNAESGETHTEAPSLGTLRYLLVRPSSADRRAASFRVETPSLAKIAST